MSETKANVLVVDDDPALRLSLSAVLESDFNVEAAADVPEAKARLTSAAFDVVLCDYEMPRETGLDLVSWIKTQQVPVMVILVTGHAKLPQLKRAEGEAAIVRILEKPYDPVRLMRLVSQTAKLSQFERARRAAQIPLTGGKPR